MRDEETAVAALIEAIRPGTRMEFSSSQAHGECDFHLVDGEARYPFEVTQFTNPRARAMYAAILGRAGSDAFVDRVLTQNDWWVFPSHLANVRRIREHVDRLLADIEREGLTKFDVRLDANQSSAVRRIWEEIRIVHGTHISWSPPGRIGISTPGDGAMLSPHQVISAVEAESSKPDNRRKLGLEAREGHLCVYVDYLGYPAHSCILSGLLPSVPPRLPEEVTHVWVVADHGEGPEYIVWSYDQVAGWQDRGAFHFGDCVEDT